MQPTNLPGKAAMANAKHIYDKLTGAGLSRNAALGILGNLHQETGGTFSPSMRQKGGPGRGIAQWEQGGRYDSDPINLLNFAQQKNRQPHDLDTQIDFMLHELNEHPEYKNVKSKLNKAQSLDEATKIFQDAYEKDKSSLTANSASNPNFLSRFKHAQNWEKSFPEKEDQPDDIKLVPKDKIEGTYKPTAEDFEGFGEETYTPTAEDFDALMGDGGTGDTSSLPYEPKGLGAIGRDVTESLLSIPETVLGGLAGIPEAAQEGYEYAGTHSPWKSVGQNILGGAELGAGLLSSPQMLARYLTKKLGGDEEGAWSKALNRTPTPYEFLRQGEEAAGLNEPEEGKEALRGLGQLLFGGAAAKALPSMTARGAAAGSAVGGEGGDPIHGAVMAMLGEKGAQYLGETPGKLRNMRQARQDIRAIPEVEEELSATRAQEDIQSQQLKELEDQLTREFGSASEPSLQRKQDKGVAKIEGMQDQLAPEVSSVVAPEEPPMLVPKAQEELQTRKQDLQQSLFHRDEPHTIAAKELTQDFESKIKDKAQDLYKANEKLLEDKDLYIPGTMRPKEIVADLDTLLKTKGWGTTDAAQLAKKVSELNEIGGDSFSVEMPADKFYSAARNTRQTAAKTRKAAYGKSSEEFDKLTAKADDLDALADKMFEVIEDAPFGQEVISNLKMANDLWRDQVKPVENNSLYKMMASKGRVKGSILDQLAGTEAGGDILENLMLENPKALRAAFGHDYAETPEKILNMNRRKEGYLNQAPQLKDQMEAFKRAIGDVEKAKGIDKETDVNYKKLEEAFTKSLDAIKKRQKAQKTIESETKQIEAINKRLAEMRAQRAAKETTSQRREELESKIEDAIQKKKASQDRLATARKILTYALGIGTAEEALRRLLRGY